MKRIAATLVLSFFVFFAAYPVSLAAPQTPTLPDTPDAPQKPEKPALPEIDFVPGEAIVQIKGDDRIYRKLKVRSERTLEEIEVLRDNPTFESVEPNYIVEAAAFPNDTFYPLQWNFHENSAGGINVEPAWDKTRGFGAVVAVLDSGIAKAPDLSETCILGGRDFVNGDSNPTDDNGHGTHIAGTIAGSTNNSEGVAGIAHEACLLPVKILGDDGRGTYTDLVDGIVWATENGAGIINLSLSGSFDAGFLKDALAFAYSKGVTIIASSGNGGKASVSFPAAYDEYAIAVGATTLKKDQADYSNYGASLDLVAPGGELSRDRNRDGWPDGILQNTFVREGEFAYYFFQGTSMATAHVSGVAALIASTGTKDPDQIRERLEQTALDLGKKGWDNQYGWGLVDVGAALGLPGEPVPTPTPVPPTNTPTPTPKPAEAENTDGKIYIEKIKIRDTKPGKRLDVKIYAENETKNDVSVSLKVTLPWAETEKFLKVKADDDAKLKLELSVPRSTELGFYKARVELYVGDKLIDAKSKEFEVKD